MNKVILIGNLTRDPELSTTNSGLSVCRISIAVSRRYASADGSRETDFFNIVAWGKLAETTSKYLRKGSQVLITGRLQNRNWEDEQGQKHYVTEVVAEEFDFTESKREQGPSMSLLTGVAPTELPIVDENSEEVISGDDLPF